MQILVKMKTILLSSLLLFATGILFISATYFGRDEAVAANAGSPIGKTGPVATTARFTLHSGPWINLHHFLYQWAKSSTKKLPESSGLTAISEKERHAWKRALDFYSRHIVKRNLAFDQELHRTKYGLFQLDGGTLTDPKDLPLGLGSVLSEALPVYKKHWWPEHDRLNRTWIGHVAPMLEKCDDDVAERLAQAYGGEWPSERIRIDLSAYANWAGAYTSNGPDHIVLSSKHWDGTDLVSLEMVFHEVSHIESLELQFRQALGSAYEGIGAEPPGRLWHAFLWYTAGTLTREALSENGVEGYQTYAERRGFYKRDSWAVWLKAFDKHWKQHMKGETDRSSALRRIVEEISR